VAGFDGNAQPGGGAGGGSGGGGTTDLRAASPSSVQRSGGSTLSPLDSMPRGEASPLADSRRALYRCLCIGVCTAETEVRYPSLCSSALAPLGSMPRG